MRAVLYDRYGPASRLRAEEIATPLVKPGEVLIRVKTVGLNAYDWRMLTGKPFLVRLKQGLFRPKNRILGADVSGVVEAVGPDCEVFAPGDEVFGCLEGSGVGGLATGGLAEFVAARPGSFLAKPAELSHEQAAALPMAGVTALMALDAANVGNGTRVLVSGAAGGVGTFVVQIAKALGAHVTAVCRTSHTGLVTSLGADEVIDRTKQDFTRIDHQFDAIIDVAANRRVTELRRVVRPGGVIVSVGFTSMARLAGTACAAMRKKHPKRLVMLVADNTFGGHMARLVNLVVAGQVTAVIERKYELADIASAFGQLQHGHPGGKMIITVDG